MSKPSLLCVVDDNPDYLYLAEFLLHKLIPDCQLCQFLSGQTMLDALPTMPEKPRLIVLDIRMPDLDGYQTLVQLKQHHDYWHIPVVMMSATSDQQEIYSCYAAGADGFVNKLLGLEQLLRLL